MVKKALDLKIGICQAYHFTVSFLKRNDFIL